MELPKNIGLNERTIELLKEKQLLYGFIYTLSSVKLETLKSYIKNYLKIGFFSTFKSLASTVILFNKKFNRSFCLYVDYQDLNNFTIKNQYLLLLIEKALDCLDWTKQFT